MTAAAGAAPPRWQSRTQRAGEWELTALSSGWLRLDGGSMWGVVPATMWRDWTPPDEDNTIRLACRPFLARRDKDVVVIEPGLAAAHPSSARCPEPGFHLVHWRTLRLHGISDLGHMR